MSPSDTLAGYAAAMQAVTSPLCEALAALEASTVVPSLAALTRPLADDLQRSRDLELLESSQGYVPFQVADGAANMTMAQKRGLADDLLDYLVAAGARAPAPAPPLARRPKRETVNRKLQALYDRRPDTVLWGKRRCAEALECSATAVAKAPAFREKKAVREQARALLAAGRARRCD